MKAAIVYDSKTGNTEKVAFAIKEGLEQAGIDVSQKRAGNAADVDFYDFDLVCFGSPSYQWSPLKSVTDLLMNKFNQYKKDGRVNLGAPKVPGKNVLIFCTYSGPHTGISEAVPVGKFMGQFFEHLGFTILDEWYIVGEFHGSEERSTLGRMGDIRGRPNKEDLEKIRQDSQKLVQEVFIHGRSDI